MILKGMFRCSNYRQIKGIKRVPDCLTYLNACFGFLSVVSALQGNFTLAAWFIACALLCDACDGRLARALGTAGFMGQELDALADAVSFCFAPALLLYVFYEAWLMIVPLLAYLCAGLFRLARFNTQKISGKGNYFVGLPTPMAAISIAALVMHVAAINERTILGLVHLLWVAGIVCMLAGCMASTLPFPTCKGTFVSRSFLRLLFVIISGTFFLLRCGVPILLSFPFGYVLGSIVLFLFTQIKIFFKNWCKYKGKG